MPGRSGASSSGPAAGDLADTPVDAGGQSRDPASWPASETHALLVVYAALLEAAAAHRLGRMRARRFAVGADRWLVEHVRESLDALRRRYLLRSAAGLSDDPSERADARRVDEFAASLPNSPSVIQRIWPFALVVIVAQVLLGLFGYAFNYFESDQDRVDTSGPGKALQELADLQVGSFAKLADLLLHNDALTACMVLTSLALAAYLVLRPWATGAMTSQLLLDPAFAARSRRAPEALRSLSRTLQVTEHERRAFAQLDASPPGHRSIEVLVRSLLASAGIFVAIALAISYSEGFAVGGASVSGSASEPIYADAVVINPSWLHLAALAMGAVSAARLCWLVREYRARRMNSGPLIAHARASAPPDISRTRRWVTVALASALTTGALAAHATTDRRAPTVLVTAPDGIAAASRGATLTLEVSCDEPCHIPPAEPARLSGTAPTGSNVRQPAPIEASIMIVDQRALRHPRANDNLDEPPGVRPQWTLTLQLTRRQAKWLSAQLKHESGAETFIDLDVADASFNVTTVGMAQFS